MRKVRTFKSVKGIIDVVKSLIRETEEQAKTPINIYSGEQSYALSDPNNINSTLEEELKLLKRVYKKAKRNLEDHLYNPMALSHEEGLLLNANKASVSFSGYYEDYILKSYSDGFLYLMGPRDKLTFSPDGTIISNDASYNPSVKVELRLIHNYTNIVCNLPLRGLKLLAMENDFFLDMNDNELNEHLQELSLELI